MPGGAVRATAWTLVLLTKSFRQGLYLPGEMPI